MKFTPWALAEVARTSLVFGNEHRPPATERDVLECCAAHSALRDPQLQRGDAASFFLRLGTEQMSYQQPAFSELARTVALLDLTPPSVRGLSTIRGDWQTRLLGTTLMQWLTAGHLLLAGALAHDGQIPQGWQKDPSLLDFAETVDLDNLPDIVTSQFATDRAGFMERQPSLGTIRPLFARRLAFNPLLARPAIKGLTDDTLIVPSPGALIRKLSPLGLYHLGLREWGNAFSEDLGLVFEAYVGNQLRLMPEVTVEPSIKYGTAESIDWFVIADDAVLFVEVKSTRPDESVRLGSEDARGYISKRLGRAVEQLNKTVRLVRDGRPEFNHIPTDRPLLGLVVTMEPFHTLNAGLYKGWLPPCDIPFRVCGIDEIEGMVSQRETERTMGLVHALMTDPDREGWHLQSAFADQPRRRNDLLDQAWNRLPWTSPVTSLSAGTTEL